MKICFVSQNGHSGKLTRDFPNCRTEFAWQLTLESDHFPIQSLLDNKANVYGWSFSSNISKALENGILLGHR